MRGADRVAPRRVVACAVVLFAVLCLVSGAAVSGLGSDAGAGAGIAAAQTEGDGDGAENESEDDGEDGGDGDGDGDGGPEAGGPGDSVSGGVLGPGDAAQTAQDEQNESGGMGPGGGGGPGAGGGGGGDGYSGIGAPPGGGGSMAYGGSGVVGGGTDSMMDSAAEWVGEASRTVINWLLENSYGRVISTPTFEATGWLGIFGEPTVEPFETLFEELHERFMLPLTLSFLILSAFLIGTWIPFSDFIGTYKASRLMFLFFILIFALAIQMPIVAAMHELSDVVGTTIAPSVDELTGSEEGIITLRTAAIPAAGGLYLFGWIKVVVYVLIYGLRDWLLTMVMPWVFGPALAMAWAAPWQKLRDFGSTVIGWHVGLLLLNIPPAIMWRSAVLVGGIEASYIDEAFAQTMYMMGALVAGVIIPIAIMWKMGSMGRMARSAAVGTAAGLAARHKAGYRPKTIDRAQTAGRRARDIGRGARQRAHTIRETVSDRLGGNNGGGGGGGGTPRRTRATGNSPWSTQAGRAQATRGGGSGTRHK